MLLLTAFIFSCSTATSGTNDENNTPKVKTVTITYNLNYEGAPVATTEAVQKGKVFTLPIPEHEGYTFTGWAKESNPLFIDYEIFTRTSFTEDTTLYAIWYDGTPAKLILNPGYEGVEPVSYNVKPNAYCCLPECPFTREGYIFSGWSSNDTDVYTYFEGFSNYLYSEKLIQQHGKKQILILFKK